MLRMFGRESSKGFIKKYQYFFSTKGIAKWDEEITSEIKLEIEKHWKPFVNKIHPSKANADNKYYVLSMFPYPSGQLHMGHVRVYAISDTLARFHKMRGRYVIHPMGWDAFGLPAENAALERQIPPQVWTKNNINKMKQQLLDLGCLFDWDREVNTSDPTYYKWTQALFLQLYKAGLVYKKEAFVNWDPVDLTVLADEQVDINGCSWRSGAQVEKKLLNQWFIKTTSFAKALYDGLDDPILFNWRDITQLQKHWIGECNGLSIQFKIYSSNDKEIDILRVWTDKPESLLSAQFIAVTPGSVLDRNDLVKFGHDSYKHLSVMAENPVSGKRIPIFITEEVVYPEGSETYLGCPEIKESDKLFILKTGIPLSDEKLITNMSPSEIVNVRKNICESAIQKNIGVYPVSSKLKDWLISRQRFWGTPIPIIICKSCGTVPIPESELPVMLPDAEVLEKNTESHWEKLKKWVSTQCPKCGGNASRETDTMDTFVDSSWYFLRYLDSNNNSTPFDESQVFKYYPVDLYIGGKEHAVLHLYYARFMSHFLHSIGKVPEREPFKRLLVQGMVMGKAFKLKESGKYIPETEVKILNEKKGLAVSKNEEKPVEVIWEKMSKSKFNGVEPSELLNEYGCDTTRLFMLGDVAPTSPRNWSDATFPGILNWQKRLWLTIRNFRDFRNKSLNANNGDILNSNEFIKHEESLKDSRNYFIKSVNFNMNYTYQLSVGISRMQGLTTFLRRVPKQYVAISAEYEKLLAYQIIMLAPMAPHFASELWSGLTSAPGRIDNYTLFDWDSNVLLQKWPEIDDNYELDFLCKVNGKEVGKISLLPAILNKLDCKTALGLIQNNEKISSKIKSQYISSSHLDVFPNCKATLYVLVNYDNEKINVSIVNE